MNSKSSKVRSSNKFQSAVRFATSVFDIDPSKICIRFDKLSVLYVETIAIYEPGIPKLYVNSLRLIISIKEHSQFSVSLQQPYLLKTPTNHTRSIVAFSQKLTSRPDRIQLVDILSSQASRHVIRHGLTYVYSEKLPVLSPSTNRTPKYRFRKEIQNDLMIFFQMLTHHLSIDPKLPRHLPIDPEEIKREYIKSSAMNN